MHQPYASLSAIIAAQRQLRHAIGIDFVPRPDSVEMRDVPMSVMLFQRGPSPFLKVPSGSSRYGGKFASIAFHFSTPSVSVPSVHEASSRFVRTSRQTAISMVALISISPPGSVFQGIFSGEKDGTKR